MPACIAVNRIEAEELEKILTLQSSARKQVDLIFCGVGLRYKTKLRDWLKKKQPKDILVLGSCGACKPDLKRGAVISVNRVKNQHGTEITLSPGENSILTVNRPVLSPEFKLSLGKKYGVEAVDMETFSCVRLVKGLLPECRIQCYRVVLDELNEDLPDFSQALLNNVLQDHYKKVQASMAKVFSKWLDGFE